MGTPKGESHRKPKYKPVEPVTLETVPEDAVFIRSRMYANAQHQQLTVKEHAWEHASHSTNWVGYFSTAKKKS
ncbi:hypothetical protein [Bacteroides xylanisolvens]|uniref:hypothetical protein n=1 Tax=Bacteroides xylanisolvens TaxID=371601 RepID=UPI001CE43A3D|nr:hypothetical protein [Bacteroides xylanisolvens]